MYCSTLSLTSTLYRAGWTTPRLGRFTPRKRARYLLFRKVAGPQGRSGQVRKISPPTEIRSSDRPVRSETLYRLSYPGPSDVLKSKPLLVKVDSLSNSPAYISILRSLSENQTPLLGRLQPYPLSAVGSAWKALLPMAIEGWKG
jgi:hypothetical protein